MKPKEQSFGAEVKAEEDVPEGTQSWKEASQAIFDYSIEKGSPGTVT